MRHFSIILALVSALLLGGCGQPGTYYEKSPQAIHAALRGAVLPYHVLGSQATGSRVTSPDQGTVVTAVLGKNGSEMIRFVTIIAPDGEGARVSTEIRGPEGANKERAAKAMAANGFAMVLMGKLAAEHVDAAIKGRPFDMTLGTTSMAQGMINASPEMRAQIDQANASAEMMNRAQDEARTHDATSEMDSEPVSDSAEYQE